MTRLSLRIKDRKGLGCRAHLRKKLSGRFRGAVEDQHAAGAANAGGGRAISSSGGSKLKSIRALGEI